MNMFMNMCKEYQRRVVEGGKDNKDNESVTTNPMMLSPSAERVRSVKHAISYGKIPTIIHHPSTQG